MFSCISSPQLGDSRHTRTHTQTFMMLWLTLTYLVGLLPSMVHSQQNLTFIEGFISSLSMLGFTDFGQTLLRINQTSDGQLILEQLSSGANFTVFVPSNDACECCFWPALLAPWHAFVWTVWTSTALFFLLCTCIMLTDQWLQSLPSTLPMQQRRVIQQPW